jgi:hypothetical protein
VTEVMFAGYPAPYVFAAPDGREAVQQLLWGDEVLATDQRRNGYRLLERARNARGWIREEDLVADRLLEVAFVDVGQGDGCLVTTPDDRHILVDAGVGSEMYWYLRWRFELRDRPPDAEPLMIDHAIVTHPDEHHFSGLGPILDSTRIAIGTLHHNGIVPRPGRDPLGPTTEGHRPERLLQLISDRDAMAELLADHANVGRARYPRMMRKALADDLVGDIRMLSADDEHLPGYDGGGGLAIDVLGPVVEEVDGTPTLRVLGDPGATGKGHSVVLRVRYGDVAIRLGGDLNVPAQQLLLQHHIGVDATDLARLDPGGRAAAVAAARAVFQVDVVKACLHDRNCDVEDLFMEATHAAVTVIHGGDEEQHAHLRPDALGLSGRWSRGSRPLIFSTGLVRPRTSWVDRPAALAASEGEDLEEARFLADAGRQVETDPDTVAARFQRAVSVFGLINLRTDGERVVLAQKRERSGAATSFDHYCLEPTADGLAWNPEA